MKAIRVTRIIERKLSRFHWQQKCGGRQLPSKHDVENKKDIKVAPLLAVLMSFAEGTSMITHGERLRFKESNRLKAIYSVLYNLDADISYGGDWLSFTGKAFLEGGHVDSYGDHRIAMSAAVASCLCREPVYLTNPIAVTKSYPDFYKDLKVLIQ